MSRLLSIFNLLQRPSKSSITVPVLDGPLMPNTALDEEAIPLYQASNLDNLIRYGDGLLFSRGRDVYSLDAVSAHAATVEQFDGEVCALAAMDGALAVGMVSGELLIKGSRHDITVIHDLSDWGLPIRLNCITALCWHGADQIIVANGSDLRSVQEWRRDLLERGNSGRIVLLDLKTRKATVLGERMAWPAGIALSADGNIFVSETWRHRVVSLALHGGHAVHVPQDALPAYPVRIASASTGGYWLSCLSVRNQLIEFILQERAYCQRMIDEIPEPYWMAPTLASGLSFKEPMQRNQLRQMGVMKPWAPTRSYGLVIRCDAQMRPVASFHSRADGVIHGVTSACDLRGDLFLCAKGAGTIVRLAGAVNQGYPS